MRKILLFLFFALCACVNAVAQQRSLEAVKQIVQSSIENRTHNVMSKPHLTVMGNKGTDDEGCCPYYIVADSANSRLFIVSGDERMQAILGECHYASSETPLMPPALKELLRSYEFAYKSLAGSEPIEEANATETLEAPDVAPILTSKWGQSSPYGDMCPGGSLSGCVATAMAQIMYHYKYPTGGKGAFKYSTRTKHYSCSYDYSNATFDWASMTDTYSKSSSTASRKAVANIMYACGVGVCMDYSPSASGAYAPDIPYAIINYFGYNPNTTFLYRPYFAAKEWYETLYDELAKHHPVLYCGVDTREGGHAFVVDGVRSKDGLVHVNWGWEGNYDGYFALDALNPQGYRFSTYQNMIIGFCPELEGEHQTPFYAESLKCKSRFDIGKAITFELIDLVCCAAESQYANLKAKFKGIIGLGLYDKDGVFIKSLYEEEMGALNSYEGSDRLAMTCKVEDSSLENGRYGISAYVRPLGSDIKTKVRTAGGKTDTYYFTVTDGDSNGEEDDSPVVPDDASTVWRQDFEGMFMPQNYELETVVGLGKWEVRRAMNLSSTQSSPLPARGKGYAALTFLSNSFTEVRNVCLLITDAISLTSGQQYVLTLQCRRYSLRPIEDANLITVLLRENGASEWSVLQEIPVTNQEDWHTFMVNLPATASNFELAFQGSIGVGATMFLDNLRISKVQPVPISLPTHSEQVGVMYDMKGRVVNKPSHGLYIIKDGKNFKKIYYK